MQEASHTRQEGRERKSPRAKLALSSRLLLLALIAKNLSLFWRLSIKGDSYLDRNLLPRCSGHSCHKVTCDKRSDHNRPLTRWNVVDRIAVEVDWYQNNRHLA